MTQLSAHCWRFYQPVETRGMRSSSRSFLTGTVKQENLLLCRDKMLSPHWRQCLLVWSPARLLLREVRDYLWYWLVETNNKQKDYWWKHECKSWEQWALRIALFLIYIYNSTIKKIWRCPIKLNLQVNKKKSLDLSTNDCYANNTEYCWDLVL